MLDDRGAPPCAVFTMNLGEELAYIFTTSHIHSLSQNYIFVEQKTRFSSIDFYIVTSIRLLEKMHEFFPIVITMNI